MTLNVDGHSYYKDGHHGGSDDDDDNIGRAALFMAIQSGFSQL